MHVNLPLCELLVVVAALTIAPQAEAQLGRNSTALRGLREVVFRTHAFGGVQADALSKRIEVELRQAGIKLVDQADGQSAVPHMDLTLMLACVDESCGYTARLALSEEVRLVRSQSISGMAITWADGYQNAIAKSDLAALPDLVAVDVFAVVKSFIADHASVNR